MICTYQISLARNKQKKEKKNTIELTMSSSLSQAANFLASCSITFSTMSDYRSTHVFSLENVQIYTTFSENVQDELSIPSANTVKSE